MFVPCIAEFCIENQHCALGFINIFIINAAPTCFGTYVPSKGSVFVLVSTWKLRQLCTSFGNVNLCVLCASLWCCTVLCFPTECVCTQLGNTTQYSSKCLAADRQGQGDTRFTLRPSVIPNSNYVIMVSDWNYVKYFCGFFVI
jgi:hypothetical protein